MDSTVYPHIMQVSDGPGRMGSELMGNDPFLRLGRIVKVHKPKDKTNTNGNFFEFDVKVDHIDDGGTLTRMIYPRCRLAPLFGGAADFRRSTFRVAETVDKNIEKLGDGSQVLVLCVNGSARDAVIVGGYHHPDATPDDPSLGHNDYVVFNGLEQIIDDNGAWTVRFNGATQADGSPRSDRVSGASGSLVQLQKDGSVFFATPSGDQSFKFDHAAKSCTIITDSSCEMDCNGIVTIKSAGVHVGLATDAWMLGTTYRISETTLHTQLVAGLTALSGQVAAAGGSLSAAGALMIAPVVGAMIASAPVIAAGAALLSSIADISQMIAAITAFEGAAPTYLSKKNLTD